MLSVGIIIIRAIVVTFPFLASFLVDVVSFLIPVLDLAACISLADDVTQVSLIPTLATLLRWSDVAGRVLVQTWVVVEILTHLLSLRSGAGSSTIAASSMSWRHLTCALTSLLSLGSKGASWLMIILEAKALCASVRKTCLPGTQSGRAPHGSIMTFPSTILGRP
jgi:hypothetical protein